MEINMKVRKVDSLFYTQVAKSFFFLCVQVSGLMASNMVGVSCGLQIVL